MKIDIYSATLGKVGEIELSDAVQNYLESGYGYVLTPSKSTEDGDMFLLITPAPVKKGAFNTELSSMLIYQGYLKEQEAALNLVPEKEDPNG